MSDGLLIIKTDGDDDALKWAPFSSAGGLSNRWQTGSVETLNAHLSDQPAERIFIVLEGTAVINRTCELPAKTDAQARAAAPFILEDDIASPAEELHFALGPDTADGFRAIAYMSDARIGILIDAFKSAGINPTGLFADHMLISDPDGAAVLIEATDGDILVNIPNDTSMRIPAALQKAVLPPLLETVDMPVKAHLITDAQQVGDNFEAAPPLSDTDRYERYLATILGHNPITLLQGKYEPRRALSEIWLVWRRAAILASLLVAAYAGAFLFETWQLTRAIDRMDVSTQSAMAEAFPGARSVAQIRARLTALRGAETNEFIALSSILFASLQDNENASIIAVRYDETRGELAVNLNTANFADIEDIKTAINDRGGQLIEGGSRQDNGRIVADVVVRRSGV